MVDNRKEAVLCRDLVSILPPNLKNAFHMVYGPDYSLADRVAVQSVLQAVHGAKAAYGPPRCTPGHGAQVVMHDAVVKAEQYLSLGL